MKHSEISDLFSQFIESFAQVSPGYFNLETNEISQEIHRHIFKIKAALWKQKIQFKRQKIMSISDIFQDIIALYLKISLDDNFEVTLEEKRNKFQPDILIKYRNQNLFIIEIKTTIGWNRNSINGDIQTRMEELANTFDIPIENVVYIFQSPWNVNNEFANKYWDKANNEPRNLPLEFPYNKIRPLLTSDDPYYWNHEKGFDRNSSFKDYSDEYIRKISKVSIVVPLELTIKEIIKASNADDPQHN